MINKSLWLSELGERKSRSKLHGAVDSDVVIVGGGIAGISTLYFLLTQTQLNIILLESDRIAHGATGNNAGHALTGFERDFRELVRDYNRESVVSMYKELNTSWSLLELMNHELKIPTEVTQIVDHGGFTQTDDLLETIQEQYELVINGVNHSLILVSKDFRDRDKIPPQYLDIVEFVEPGEILSRLETLDERYIAAHIYGPSALMISAEFTHNILEMLEQKFPHRLEVYEHTPAEQIKLFPNAVQIDTPHGNVSANTLIMCTNGYKQANIIDGNSGQEYLKIKTQISQIMGEVVAFPSKKQSYFGGYYLNPEHDLHKESYLYINRRKLKDGLYYTAIGGAELGTDIHGPYSDNHSLSQESLEKYQRFLKSTKYDFERSEFAYHWEGIMGYTPNRIRWIGPDTKYPNLYYNLGCNGIGLMQSIYGGWKLAGMLDGAKFSPSLFDPN